MNGDFLPEFKTMPAKAGGYRGMYRLFDGKPFRLIPGLPSDTAGQALAAAKEYVCAKLNPPIRAEQAEPCDILGIAAWHEEKAAQRAAEQEQALGAIIVKGRQVKVERRRERA